MSVWEQLPLGEFLERITYGFTNPMPTTDSGPFMVTARDINEGRILYDQARSTSWDAYRDLLTDKSRPELGDVLVTKDGTLGRIAIVDRKNVCINQSVALLRPNDRIYSSYLKYVLGEPSNFARMLNDADGSTIKHIYITRLAKMVVRVPDRFTQRQILSVLSSLDDKIELNRRMNETLEALAQAIFKDWFVDFGPTRRKSEGTTDPVAILGNLIPDPARARETAALFPATFGDDGLPEGWTTRAVKELCVNIANGGTPKRDMPNYWEPGTIPWLTSGEVRKPYLIETSQFISAMGFENSSAKWVEPFATVVALYGATAGQVALVANRMTTNQAICALTSKDGYRFLTYLALSAGKESLASMATGSAQQNLSKGLVENFATVDPTKETSKVFDDLATPLFEKIIVNELENRTLAETRDYLLPKLISGEVRVRDAEKIAG